MSPNRRPGTIADLMQQASELSPIQKRLARVAFLEKLESKQTSVWRPNKLLWGSALATLAAALLATLFIWPKAKLDYEVSGAVDEGGYIRTMGDRPVQVTFTDKTLLSAHPGSRLRVVETVDKGARISVEQGQLDANITHTGQSAWRFVAGPFQVHVTGTRFNLNWDTQTERLEVVLREGSVEIEGYTGSGVVTVKAGQRFIGDARLRTMSVSDFKTPVVATTLPAALDPQGPDPTFETTEVNDQAIVNRSAEARGLAQAGDHNSAVKTISWASMIAKGEFKRVVAAAHARGTSSCLATCDASELGALADAARYTGQTQLAEQSLLALRVRFSATSGSRAAFLLGRLEEGRGNQAQARSWYEISLREAPAGAFAAESLAGRMRVVNALSGRAQAAPIAKEYLRLYPRGVHAATARQLVQTP